MTCADAKKVPILDICDRLGAKKASINAGKRYALYHAPYREDRHPSLKLNLMTNRWYDLATGQSGDVIDLVCLTNNTSINGALSYLAGCTSSLFKSSLPFKKEKAGHGLTILPLAHPLLLKYMKLRGISVENAQRFCSEAHYVVGNGVLCFSVAFASDSGGYELRNSRFKGCRGPKDISIIGKGSTFLFFEGFIDFLTYIQMYGYENDVMYIILNSAILVQRALDCLKSFQLPLKVEMWLDNDISGRIASNKIMAQFPSAADMSNIYVGCKDLNEYFVKDNQRKYKGGV